MRLASQGVGVTPGTPFAALPVPAPHVRVTAGLVARDHAAVAERLAAAAHGAVRIPV
jgi:hypothetical protein